ncbi:phosphonate C-P lyase system protein PhnH [Ornithinibacillus sp. JPR2-1]|uniref:phosphonate C-P lyase system protein PhnH n=2 Tax=unclassified Ornithinibacillus TaxID=2620869 RepID=UPI0031CE947B
MMMNIVHDTQAVFRNLLHSMSRPGEISKLNETSINLSSRTCHQATMLTMLTLFDAEIGFHILTNDQQNELQKQIMDYTSAKIVPMEEADFVIVLQGTDDSTIVQAMEKCKIGNLIDPQYSATWILECESIKTGRSLRLSGPGINQQTTIQVNLSNGILAKRNELVKEYPLGIDMIVTDASLQVVCIPRTTTIEPLGGA